MESPSTSPNQTILEVLNSSAIAKLEGPKKGFEVDAEAQLQTRGGLSEGEVETLLDIIDREKDFILKNLIASWLREYSLPSELEGHAFYRDFLTTKIEEEGEPIDPKSPLIRKRNILPFLPRCPSVPAVMEVLDAVASKCLQESYPELDQTDKDVVQRAKKAIRTALLMALQDNILAMDNQPLLNVAIGTDKTEDLKSLRDIRRIVKDISEKVGSQTINTEDACVELVRKIEIFRSKLTQKERKEFLDTDMPECLKAAAQLYKNIGSRIQEAQEKFHIGGKQIMIDLVVDNEFQNIFELLQSVMEQSREQDQLTEEKLQTVNEAQAIAYLAYLFYYVRKHPYFKISSQKERQFRKEFIEKFFQRKGIEETVQVNVNKEGNILANGEDEFGYREVNLRHLQLKKWEVLKKQRIYFEGIRAKTPESIVKKLLLKPDTDIENIFDLLGGRIFLWDINREDVTNLENGRAVRNDLYILAQEIGKAMGLEMAFKEREKLNRGEFCIEDKIDQNSGNNKSYAFPAIKVYGKTEEGYGIEFQIVLKDGYISSKSKGSPNHEKFYETAKDLELAQIIFPASVFPEIHHVAKTAREKLKEIRNCKDSADTASKGP